MNEKRKLFRKQNYYKLNHCSISKYLDVKLLILHNCLSSSRFSRKSAAHYFTSEKANFPENKANINIKQLLFNIELNLQRPLSKKQKGEL